MVFEDNAQHAKPHIHVFYDEFEASIGIDGEVLAGSLPPRQMRIVQGWIALHENELYSAWNNAVQKKPVEKIKPLE